MSFLVPSVISTSPRSLRTWWQPLTLPRQVTVDSGDVGAGGATTDSTRSEGALLRGAGGGGSGTGGCSSGVASSGSAGSGGVGTGGASSGGVGAGGAGSGGASSEETGAGGERTGEAGIAAFEPARAAGGGGAAPAAARGGVAVAAARGGGGAAAAAARGAAVAAAAVTAAAAAAATAAATVAASCAAVVPTCEWPSGPCVTRFGPTFPPSHPADFPHYCRPCLPHARPSSPTDDLHTALFCSSRRCSPPASVLSSPPKSSLTIYSTPISDYYRAARLVVSRVLSSLVTNPRASPPSASFLTAAVGDFTTTRRLDYATRVVAARPLSVGGESSLGCDVLEDRQFKMEVFAAASPSLSAMLLSPEGDPDAFDILTPCMYYEAVSGEWASQWKAAMDSKLAS
ncbi:unnamed protein product [Closterium sp. NIES-54]